MGKVVINSEGTHEALAFMKEFWEAACDPGGFLGRPATTAPSLADHRRDPERRQHLLHRRRTPRTDYPGLAEKLDHFLNPEGPLGPVPFRPAANAQHHAVLGEQGGGGRYIRWSGQEDNLDEFIAVNQGYIQGLEPKWETHPVWQSDPAIAIYATNPRYGRTAGYAGPWNRQSGEAQEKYIIVDMFARAARGEDPEEVAAGQSELEDVYGA